MKKKALHGKQEAFGSTHRLVKNAKPNNKFIWLRDDEIINQQDPPIEYIAGQFWVRLSPTETKMCDISRVNEIGTEIMTNSLLDAINDTLKSTTDNFDNMTETERDLGESYLSPVYNALFGDHPYDHIDKIRKMQVNCKHLKEVTSYPMLPLPLITS